MTQRQQAAQDCLKAAKMLYARGMVNAYEGNVSVRVGGALLITPSQVCKEELTEDDLVEVDIESGATVCTKPGRVASSEVKLHLTAYRARPDVMGVAHAHPPFATAFAVAGRPIRTRAYPEMIVLYDHIPLCRYGGLRPTMSTSTFPTCSKATTPSCWPTTACRGRTQRDRGCLPARGRGVDRQGAHPVPAARRRAFPGRGGVRRPGTDLLQQKGDIMRSDPSAWPKLISGCDIRGEEAQLSDEFAQHLGYAFALWLARRLDVTPDHLKIAVGHDSRLSAPRLKAALIYGITAADSDVFDCGMCTTPAMYLTTLDEQLHADGAVMITASHHPAGKTALSLSRARAAWTRRTWPR